VNYNNFYKYLEISSIAPILELAAKQREQ